MNAYIVYILWFTVILGPPCVKDKPHITHGLSFALGTRLGIGGIRPLPVLVDWSCGRYAT
jgi:hypothetical protein